MGDRETMRSVNICGDMRKFLWCSVNNADGTPAAGCPRGALATVVKALKDEFDIEPLMFSELEFFLLNQDGTPSDEGAYLSCFPEDKGHAVRREMFTTFDACGMNVRRVHHECGAGQHELELNLAPALKNADDTVMGVYLTRLIAAKHGYDAVFSPKPFPKAAGNGLHMHLHLRRASDLTNVMEAPNGQVSELGKTFIAGILAHAREITAVFGRSEETYARFTAGQEAPIWSVYDFSNRNAIVRIPSTPDYKRRCEFRAGDASGSPHLLATVILAAGLDGLRKQTVCPPPCKADPSKMTEDERAEAGVQKLPVSLREATEILAQPGWLDEAVGSHLRAWLHKPTKGHD
eukprot:gnl/Ergobibamus_cyprinoides/1250.p1 GENE.gnl/Ergobibamus_cyprinoides/1250~~gnl/Ergobibamus_cyprinoides/1250.p1  ORF type:complete len:407 (-),score=191.30 gnl/Ergobibamus_cyprinoides/1250:994-2037(-)